MTKWRLRWSMGEYSFCECDGANTRIGAARQLPLMTRGTYSILVAHVELDGWIRLGAPDRDALWRILWAHGREKAALNRHLDTLVEMGLVEEHAAGFRVPDFTPCQWCLGRERGHVRRQAARQRTAILDRDEWRCRYCGADLDADNARVDHVIPVSRFGTSAPHNLVAACHPCNSSKGAKTPEEWLQ